MQNASHNEFLLGQRSKSISIQSSQSQPCQGEGLFLEPDFVPPISQRLPQLDIPQDRRHRDWAFALPRTTSQPPSPTLKVKQYWEGMVLECKGEQFTALLVDKTNPHNADEVMSFDFEEVAPDDAALVQPGAAFYCAVGQEKSPGGQIKNVMQVVFRRLPRWTTSALKEAEESAKEIFALFSDV